MMLLRSPWSALFGLGLVAAVGCSAEAGPGARPASGGTTSAGAGGTVGSGGALGSGGSGVTGGNPGAGGSIATGGVPAGGTVGSGGSNPSGGSDASGGSGGSSAGGTGGGKSGLGDQYPCDGTTTGYDATVINNGGTWTVQHGGSNEYTGADMLAAMQAGIDSLGNRNSKQSVLVQGDGSVSAGSRLNITSYTVLNVCGTINVTGSGSGDMAPIYARGRTDIDIPNVKITGAPVYGMFFRETNNVHLGNVDIRVTGGLGVRIDNGPSHPPQKNTGYVIDYVYVEGTGTQGVETYGIDGITIGTVIARNVHDSGLLLNDTVNAEVGLVDAEDTGANTGYAAFRMANRNGRIDDMYPVNIHVGKVRSLRGGRGIFCVSESGGAVIDQIDIQDAGNNSILLENCYNVNIAAQSGSVTGGGEIRISSRPDEFEPSRDITIQNLTVTDCSIREEPCADNSTFSNNTLVNSSQNICN